MLRGCLRLASQWSARQREGSQAQLLAQALYSSGRVQSGGFQDFFDVKAKPDDMVTTGRAWTVPDLRRKSFDDLHKLWFVLYKERNLLLSEREKTRRNQRPVLKPEENRYTKVKRSMAGIKIVLNERKRIQGLIDAEGVSTQQTEGGKSTSSSSHIIT